MCMCVCIYIYIEREILYTYICMCVYIYIYTHTYTYMYSWSYCRAVAGHSPHESKRQARLAVPGSLRVPARQTLSMQKPCATVPFAERAATHDTVLYRHFRT